MTALNGRMPTTKITSSQDRSGFHFGQAAESNIAKDEISERKDIGLSSGSSGNNSSSSGDNSSSSSSRKAEAAAAATNSS